MRFNLSSHRIVPHLIQTILLLPLPLLDLWAQSHFHENVLSNHAESFFVRMHHILRKVFGSRNTRIESQQSECIDNMVVRNAGHIRYLVVCAHQVQSLIDVAAIFGEGREARIILI